MHYRCDECPRQNYVTIDSETSDTHCKQKKHAICAEQTESGPKACMSSLALVTAVRKCVV